MTTPPKAYSYLRFSSPDQIRGHSLQRQSEASQLYAQAHGLELDESLKLTDLGVSAFRGKNWQEGALGKFIEAIDSGLVPRGSYLLVENLDRLSRDTINVALKRFMDILEREVHVVTLHDSKVFTKESLSNLPDLVLSVMSMHRAHEESLIKSKRLSAVWSEKKKRARESGLALTPRVPAWLKLNKTTNKIEPIEERVAIIKRIFELTIDGIGKRKIAQILNQEGIPTFGRSKEWHDSYIQKIVSNEAVIGIYQPYKEQYTEGKSQRVHDGEPIENYFPIVIDPATFYRARASQSARMISGGRKGIAFTNLFTGFVYCGVCGSSMHFINKGKGRKGGDYLICSGQRLKSTVCPTYAIRYDPVQTAILFSINELDLLSLFPDIRKQEQSTLQALEDKLVTCSIRLSKDRNKLDNSYHLLLEDMSNKHLKEISVKLAASVSELEAEELSLKSQLDILKARSAITGKQDENLFKLLIEAHSQAEGIELYTHRSKLHQLLKRTISRIEFQPGSDKSTKCTVDIHFHGIDNYYRRIKFKPRYTLAECYLVKDKQETFHVATECVWPPQGRILSGHFLEKEILGSYS